MWAQQKMYRERRYDQKVIYLPKGRLQDVKDYVDRKGVSVNGLINELLRKELDVSEEDWQDIKTA